MVVDRLGAHPNGEQGGTEDQEHRTGPLARRAAQQSQQQGNRDGEEQGKEGPGRGEGVKAVEL